MKVILRQDVENLGKMGDIVEVRDGYARNYLIPRGLAYYASEGAIRRLEQEKRQYQRRLERERISAQELAAQLEQLVLSIPMRVGEEGRLFGSVTPQMIADELSLRGFTIDRRAIVLEEPDPLPGHLRGQNQAASRSGGNGQALGDQRRGVSSRHPQWQRLAGLS
jgi:large subunit ribosomal protein L9